MVSPADLEPGETIVRSKERYGSGGGSRQISRTVAEVTEDGVRVRAPDDGSFDTTVLSAEQVRNKWHRPDEHA
ncbi:MAG: hypothetical protein ABEH60_03780 [Halonotius sp.]|mgnify:FL=1|jgi:hypothetical protein